MDEDLADALSDEDEVKYIILNLTKLSLFEEASNTTIRVHRMVQDIIKEEVNRNKNCLKETLENVQRMLTHALETEESPESLQNIDSG